MAAFAFSLFLAAMYTLAFLASNAYIHGRVNTPFLTGNRTARNTLTVSFPIPVFPPVTITTFPVKSGMWSVENLDFGAK